MTKSKPQLKFPLRKIVEVEWSDASGQLGWQEISTYAEHLPEPCRTAGYLLEKNDTCVVVALSQSVSGDANSSIAIPLGWILSLKTIRT